MPDAFGLALGTGVLGGVLVLFGLAVRIVSGTVAKLSYTIGRAVAEGIAAWSDPDGAPEASPSDPGMPGGPTTWEPDAAADPVLRLERLRAPHTRMRCAPLGPAVAC